MTIFIQTQSQTFEILLYFQMLVTSSDLDSTDNCAAQVSTFFTLCWLVCPWWGRLATFMADYEKLLRSAARRRAAAAAGAAQLEPQLDKEQLLGEMHDIYYDNSDLRLLLDLLAATTGLAQPIR